MNNSQPRTGTEAKNMATSMAFLIVGVGVLWLAKSQAGIDGDAVLVSLLLIPLIMYLTLSGKLTGLKGPGGLEATFREAATQSVTWTAQTVEPSQGTQVIAKEGIRDIQARLGRLDESRPILMTIKVGQQASYDWDALKRYMTALSQFRNFKFIVFIDQNDRLLAYMPSWAFRGLINLPELGDEFINRINQGDIADLRRYPGVVQETISTRSSNVDALRQMMRQNLEALVVTDEQGLLKGVVERDQLVSRILLDLVPKQV
jgi:hypothetical protein